jgi:oligopeptide transport system substrate-binding protein
VLRRAEEVLIEEDMAILPIYHYASIDLVDTDMWGGWYPNILSRHPWKCVFRK